MDIVYRHYSRDDVREAIWEFCRGRWVAIEGSIVSSRIFIRYSAGKPLSITSKDDIPLYIYKYKNLNIRTFYASINIYNRLENIEQLDDIQNIVGITPFWDIDSALDKWRYAVEAAKIIYRALEAEGVSRSVHFVWSGEGIHVRIHENAIPKEVFASYNPTDVAYAIVEYVIRKVREDLEKLHRESGGVLKVENLIDMKRVFTTPLALHRKHDVVAIVIDPKDIDDFDLSWVQVESFKSSDIWKRYEEGEAENLVKRAMEIVGRRNISRTYVKRREISVKSDIPRFQVMALLQAARYYILTGDIVKAKSFGLNRAIFYAYLKHYGRFQRDSRRRYMKPSEDEDILALLNQISKTVIKESIQKASKIENRDLPVKDNVETSDRGLFMIGGKEQREEDFDKNVVRKINSIIPFELAWEAAIKYVSRYPRAILIDPQKFYKHVYEPVREGFIEKVVKETIHIESMGLVSENVRDVTSRNNIEKVIRHHSLLKWVKKEKES